MNSPKEGLMFTTNKGAWFKGLAAHFYDSGIQKLVPRLDNAGDYAEKRHFVIMYRQFIHSVVFVN